jgi:integrase/recombinase XerC
MTLQRRPSSALTLPAREPVTLSIDQIIVAWLDAKHQRSHSTKTERAYRDTLTGFRAALLGVGLDLDGPPQTIALAAQGWVGRDDPKPATYNQRLAILSSFYTYAMKRGVLHANPADTLDRAKVQAYAGAQGLDHIEVDRRMQAIDRTTLQGKRDYALLSVALVTGRRVKELANLRWGDAEQRGAKVTLTFQRTKGGKVMRDTLPIAVSRALLAYLHAQHGAALGTLASDTPIWISARNRALAVNSIALVCEKHLGTSRVHTLRHTFAREMEAAGAKVSDIQARLGHESLATTGRYLAALKQAENAHADALAERFGFTDEEGAE